jgi:hypothetical protein
MRLQLTAVFKPKFRTSKYSIKDYVFSERSSQTIYQEAKT